jgi:aldehyde decarbonylase
MIAQRQELSAHCGLYIQRHPKMNIKVVDGSSLVVATILNSIPKGNNQVLLRGGFNKIALAIINALCIKNVQV